MNKTVTMVIAGILAAGLMVVASYANNVLAATTSASGGSGGTAGSTSIGTGALATTPANGPISASSQGSAGSTTTQAGGGSAPNCIFAVSKADFGSCAGSP